MHFNSIPALPLELILKFLKLLVLPLLLEVRLQPSPYLLEFSDMLKLHVFLRLLIPPFVLAQVFLLPVVPVKYLLPLPKLLISV